MMFQLKVRESHIKVVLQIKNENSKGSVIPVKNDVNAADNIKPPTTFYVLDEHFYRLLVLLPVIRTS